MAFQFTKGYEDYAKFPMHYMKVTQSYNEGNHKAHWYGATPKDFPIDLAGEDTGRDYLLSAAPGCSLQSRIAGHILQRVPRGSAHHRKA